MKAVWESLGRIAWRGLRWAACLAAVMAFPAEATVHARASSASTGTAAEASFDAAVVSLHLYPEERTLRGGNASQQYVVTGTLADGSRKDLTDQASFSLSDPKVARAGERGRFAAVADGETEVVAVVGQLEARSRLRVEDSGWTRPFHFSRDVLSILTRRGCNQTECHSGLKGRGGFKLSMNASHPRQDYDWIVQGGMYQVLTDEPGDPKIPRVNLKEPDKSLLLQKPTMQVPHVGGPRIDQESREYALLLDWVQRGSPYGEKDSKRVKAVRMELFPRETVLRQGEEQQLVVSAHLSDGSVEDYTRRVRFDVNHGSVADISPSGLVKARNGGETAILVRGAGHEVLGTVGVVADRVADYPDLQARNFIDERIFSKLRRFNIVPAELSSDSEFLRRVCLDLTGRIPPVARVKEFLADPDPQKREKLVEALLDSPEYVDYWTFRFADLFRVSVFVLGINPKWSQSYWEWIRDAVERNRPYDEVARERMSSQGYSAPSRHYLPYLVVPPPENMMGEQVRVFMGRRLDCAQCHDHPYERWTQNQFWGMTAFFGSMFKLGANPESVIFDHPNGTEVAADVPSPKDLRVLHPRTGEVVDPVLLDGTRVAHTPTNYPRGELAKWATSHPYFAEAAVNRMWSYFFGRGLVEPVDDFRSNNPPTHPQLLRQLAQYFADNGYDLKQLFRLIVSSRTYQLSSTTRGSQPAGRAIYAHAPSRPLEAEILLDAICDVTGVPEHFPVPAFASVRTDGAAPKGTRAIHLKEPDVYASSFLDIYGRPTRFSVPERDSEPMLSQALHILAGSTYNEKLWTEGSRVYDLFRQGASDGEIVEDLYLAAFSRFPTPSESEELSGLIARTTSREQALRDLQWAVLSSREFAENH